MERVAFLLEHTGQRLSCLLNPSDLVIRRTAGVRPRYSIGGALTGKGLADHPLLFTGGGMTWLELALLFDVSLSDSGMVVEDVRELTGPLWELAENMSNGRDYGRPPLVRLVWGKSWNIPGIVTAVAERLEYFTETGVPRRSWLRMRLYRVKEPALPEGEALHTAAMDGSSLAGSDGTLPAGGMETQPLEWWRTWVEEVGGPHY